MKYKGETIKGWAVITWYGDIEEYGVFGKCMHPCLFGEDGKFLARSNVKELRGVCEHSERKDYQMLPVTIRITPRKEGKTSGKGRKQ